MKILRSIKGKLILFTLCISLIPIFIITTVYYLNARSALKKQILRELTAIAESKKLHVETFLNAIKARTADFSSDGFIRDSLNKINHDGLLKQDAVINLNKHLKDNKLPLDPDIAAITILDKAGMVVASTVESTIGKDFSDYEEYVHCIDKDINEVFIHSPHFSEYLGQNAMEVAAPIISMKSGESIGVIMNAYKHAIINYITSNRKGMGDSGEIVLGLRDGDNIQFLNSLRYAPDAALTLRVPLDAKAAEPMRLALEGHYGTIIGPDYRNTIVIAVYQHIPSTNWGLVAKIDKTEAFAPLKTLSIVALILGGVCAAVTISLGIVFSLSTARPINRLKYASERIASGNLKHRVDITRKDEIGDLAVSFNEMVEKLQDSNSALHESEEMFRTINASANDAIITIDNEGKVLFWNKAAEKMFSYSSEEVVGIDLCKLVVPVKLHGDFINGFKGFQDTGQGPYIGKTVELTAINRDGTEFPIEHSVSAVKIKGKWNAIGIIRDITERRKSEEVIKGLAKFPSENPNPVLRIKRNGTTLFANNAGSIILDNWGTQIDQPVPEDWQKHVLDVLRSGKSNNYDIECNDHIFSITLAPIVEEGYVNLYGLDITERKKMEEELIKTQKLESVGILAGGIAHDFNNNLQAILSSIMLAETYTDSKDEISKILEEAKKVIFRSKNLTRQLLTFSKGGEPIKNTILVSKLIRESARLALSGSNVRCEFDIQGDLWPVDADKGQMNQVISNLVINANQAMTDGGIIRLRAENTNEIRKDSLPIEGRCVKITIEDNGTGISQENLQKIFDPYFTTKKKGNGLGLAITYSIIKKHGGYITVESETGVGTTFHIYLPASPQKEIQKRTDPSASLRIDTKPHEVNDEEGKPSKIKGKILLMDDEDVIRISVTQYLRNQKYEVKTAKEGTEAIKLYKKAFESGKPFDAVIIDLTIVGGMGGEGTIKELLGIDPDVKAIVSSGYSNDPVMANFREYGFRDVLAKPYETQELDEALQKVIMRKEE